MSGMRVLRSFIAAAAACAARVAHAMPAAGHAGLLSPLVPPGAQDGIARRLLSLE